VGRLALLLTSPRVAPGLMTYAAWQAVASASRRVAASADEPVAAAVVDAGFDVETSGARGETTAAPGESTAAPGESTAAPADGPGTGGTAHGDVPALARRLVDAASTADVVWLGSADGDPGLTDAVASEVTRLEDPPEVEVVVGSWDVPGSRLLDVVAVMDRLRSPGGCPWDAQQTHDSLAPYLLEEAHEAVEAIAHGDRAHLAEELGDVLLQVVFHARVAEEAGEDGFDVDDVAGHLVDKLVRRHPHVFADGEAATPEEVERNWERIKADERTTRRAPTDGQISDGSGDPSGDGLLDGIPASLPALLAAQKVLARWERRGGDPAALAAGDSVGAALIAVVARARAEGVSAETELRAALRDVAGRVGPGGERT
jgi:XTP/dITP diphosphohydrolase